MLQGQADSDAPRSAHQCQMAPHLSVTTVVDTTLVGIIFILMNIERDQHTVLLPGVP